MSSSEEAMECLRKTGQALTEIRKQLLPFLRDLGVVDDSHYSSTNPNLPTKTTINNAKTTSIQASMAVALAMGTLRYMAARLRGLDQGRKSDDPLRQELNNMRKLMVTLQKKLDATKKKKTKPEDTKRKAAVDDDDKTKKATTKAEDDTPVASSESATKKRRKR